MAKEVRKGGSEARDAMVQMGKDIFVPAGDLVQEAVSGMFSTFAAMIESDSSRAAFDAIAEAAGDWVASGVFGMGEALIQSLWELSQSIDDSTHLREVANLEAIAREEAIEAARLAALNQEANTGVNTFQYEPGFNDMDFVERAQKQEVRQQTKFNKMNIDRMLDNIEENMTYPLRSQIAIAEGVKEIEKSIPMNPEFYPYSQHLWEGQIGQIPGNIFPSVTDTNMPEMGGLYNSGGYNLWDRMQDWNPLRPAKDRPGTFENWERWTPFGGIDMIPGGWQGDVRNQWGEYTGRDAWGNIQDADWMPGSRSGIFGEGTVQPFKGWDLSSDAIWKPMKNLWNKMPWKDFAPPPTGAWGGDYSDPNYSRQFLDNYARSHGEYNPPLNGGKGTLQIDIDVRGGEADISAVADGKTVSVNIDRQNADRGGGNGGMEEWSWGTV
jgi:hypothetical protein